MTVSHEVEVVHDQQRCRLHEFLGEYGDECLGLRLCSERNTEALPQSIVSARRQSTERVSEAIGKCSDIR